MYLRGSVLDKPWPRRGGVIIEAPLSEDSQLLIELQSGESLGLEKLFDQYSTLAFTVAVRVLGNSEMAEDVVQESFLRVWRSIHQFDPARSSLRSWVITIVRNRCFDELRRLKVRPQLSPEADISFIPGRDDVLGDVTRTLEAERVRTALAALPEAQRETLQLAYYAGFSQSEIAQQMGVPLGTVKGRTRMAVTKLREQLAGLRDEERA